MVLPTSEALHRFFYFLGTPQGALFLTTIELIFFSLITYMIVSEFLRTREEELEYLAIAFGVLSLQRLVLEVSLWLQVYKQFTLELLPRFLPLLQYGLELIAIVLLVNAFLYPFFKSVKIRFLGSAYIQLAISIVLIVAVELAWLIARPQEGAEHFGTFWGNTIFTAVSVAYLLLVIVMLTLGHKAPYKKYQATLVMAFVAYLVALLVRMTNFVFFEGENARLIVAEHPLPFISALLFMRIVYLRLVDKATLQDRLRESESRLEAERRVGKMKDEFVSTVSHELRTPLTAIKLYVSLLRNGKLGELHPKQKDALQTLHDESERLANLIDDLLDLSKLESGKDALRVTAFKPHDFLHNNLHYQLAREKGIKVGIRADPRTVVRVDVPKFKQLFVNLVSNAIKFTEAGGTVTIALEKGEKEWTLRVSDTGKGIEKKKLAKLFEKFYQADDYMTRTQRGTGLGLAIVKKIAEMHGARVSVGSKVGHGSTFTVTFPNNIAVGA